MNMQHPGGCVPAGQAQDTPSAETSRQLRIHGHIVRVSERPGIGRPLVLCNGIGAALGVLQPLVETLDPLIPTIRFDVPGIGASPAPRLPYSFAWMAHVVGTILEHLGYGRADILGISWGGALAQQFAFQNPRRCARLVLANTATGCLMVPARPAVLAMMLTPRRYRDKEFARRVAPMLYGGELRNRPEIAAAILEGHSQPPTLRGYALQLAAGVGWSSLPALPLVRQPTLVLAGDDDPIVPLVNARIMTHLLPRATLHVFHDGHLGLLTSARTLGPVISKFLRPDQPQPSRERT
jgi:poly(3-hydroxyalkanoate) depolymerase